MSIGKLKSVSVVGEALLSIGWDDGRVAPVDLGSSIAKRPALASLSDPRVLAQVALAPDGWSLEWPGEIDFGAAQLRRWADEQAGDAMPSADFRAWVDARGLTPDHAADALGLPHRTIALYLSGEQPVPKTVMLATEGYGRRAAA